MRYQCNINAIDGVSFAARFAKWAASLSAASAPCSVADAPELVAIDRPPRRRPGARRRSGPTTERGSATRRGWSRQVSARTNQQRLVPGQQACAAKSKEITAIPLLLEWLATRGAMKTIDAMDWQTRIVQTILDCGADHLLAVEENRPSLHAAVERDGKTACEQRCHPVFFRRRGDLLVHAIFPHRQVENRVPRG
jgi:predicted transposase YbfD/YdcC